MQRTVKKIGNFETMFWVGAITSLVLFPFVRKDLALLADGGNFIFLFMLGCLVFVMNYFAFEGYKKGKLCVVEVVSSIELPLTILLGIIIFHERPTPLQAILMLVIFSGIFLISRRGESSWDKAKKFFTGRENLLEKGIFFAAIGGLLSALVNFLVAFDSRAVTPLMAIWFPWFVFTALSFFYIITKKGFGEFLASSKESAGLIAGAGLIDAAAWTFFALALAQNELSITTAITESYPAIAMFLGIKFNKENISAYQYAGGLVVLAASIMIGLYP
jgi:drug/metabolite transporter (DMT)-like permease